MRLSATFGCLACGLLEAAMGSAQTETLAPDVRKALEARRNEIEARDKAASEKQAAVRTPLGPTLHVEAGPVTESRPQAGAATLTVPLVVLGDDLPPDGLIRRHEIVSALDDRGQRLMPSANPGADASVQSRGDSLRLSRPLVFESPVRHPASIKSIQGTLEVFMPSEDNGSLVRIADLGSRDGKLLEHPLLAKAGIAVTCLTKEMYDAMKPKWANSIASAAQPPNFGTSAVFLVTDKSRRFAGVELRAANGSVIPATSQILNTNVLGTSVVVSRSNGPLPGDAEVRFFVENPAAVKFYPFRLENIPVPASSTGVTGRQATGRLPSARETSQTP